MGRKCSVENCTSDSTKPEHTGVTFHKVPLHTDIRPKWLSLCRIPEDKTTTKLLYVCSRHFLRADFCSFKGKKYMLRQGVLPSVFPWDKSRLEAIKAEVTSKKDVDSSKKKEKTKIVKKKEVKIEDVPSPRPPEVKSEIDVPKDVTMEKEETEIKVEPTEIKIEADEPNQDATTNENGEDISIPEPEMKPEIQIEEESLIKENITQDIDLFDQHQMSQDPSAASTPINFAISSRIEVLDNNNIWYPAKINEVDYEESEVLIHFEKSTNKYDEWISMSSPRLRPLQPRSHETFEVGERCMAVWCDTRKFPATVTKKMDSDSYEVLFDDGFVKIVKNHKMSKMNVAKPAQASPLFEPVKGTKQDRRDKKRKLNVAALFPKRPRLSNPEDKKSKASPVPVAELVEEACPSPVSQEETSVTVAPPLVTKWYPSWEDGKPVGIESTIDGSDGLRNSVIVPDPRLPPGWTKHLTQRIYGNYMGKWDAVILAPDGKKFRSKQEVKNYLELHPGVEAELHMFDFSISRKGHKRKPGKPKQKLLTEPGKPKQKLHTVPVKPVETLVVQEPQAQDTAVKEEKEEEVPGPEEPPVSLKIIFENDAYKCPIEGCGKNFRRENLALMHVKHYHSEYTKYLDSTPNVADLAYARTVGESLDRSPGPPKASSSKTSEKIQVTPKTSKVSQSTHLELFDDNWTTPEIKTKDSEIIKLLNKKPVDSEGDIQPLPSGLPSNMYPDINLKDLLGKSDEIAMRDDIHIKNLCSSRPSQGIKTLLPVRHATQVPTEIAEEKAGTKRKRAVSDTAETLKGKPSHHPAPAPTLESQQQPSHQQQPPPPSQHQLQQATLITDQHPLLPTDTDTSEVSSIPSAFDLAPPPAGLEVAQAPTVTQFDGVIIEGGKIIKLERMKQEEIINCTCGFIEEDGLMIQCELCLCWQHAYCNNIQKESEVPEKYVCYICQHPLRERQSAKYLHDQDWLKQGVLPVASYHSKDKRELDKRFEKLKKCHDLSGGLLELRDYMHTLGVKLKIAEAKNHPKLYLWSKPWEKPKLPEKSEVKDENEDVKPKPENADHQYEKNGMELDKQGQSNDNMLMMMLKSSKEEIPMLNMHNHMAPIIPQPEAAIDSDDCRLNLLDHIAHAESLVDERLDDFEKQLDALEEGMNLEMDEDYPKTRQTIQMLMRDLDTLKRFSELPMI